ncbi:MAG: 4Fe-4S binding protein, partial [Clostridiales bacterium]|nr:4Fe-4S binding protein [Clostridiales bacterium]
MIFSNGVKICGITLNRENCKGCVLCMRKCPTEAIRVRGGKARIIAERCVSCGECVRACPTGAKNAVFTPLSEIEKRKYKIAVPCPSIYGQFNNLDDINHILCGLIDMGFSKVAEVAVGCEIVSEAARAYLARPDTVKPVINTSCPAVVKLIQLRFSQFLDHLLPVETPEEITAAAALEQALGAGYKREDIGVYIISPCSAKVEALAGNPNIDGVLAFSEVYFPLLQRMNASKRYEDMAECGRVGLGWGVSG